MAIRYQAYTEQGEKVSGSLPVEREAAAEEILWRSNLVIVSLKPERSIKGDVLRQVYKQLPTIFRPKAHVIVAFSRDLATLLEAGISLHSALALLKGRITNPLLLEAVVQITREVEEGNSLSSAVAKHSSIFPPLYTRLLSVGEETGDLERVLRQIADYMERQAMVTRRVMQAVRYPAIVLSVGAGATFILATYSLPAIAGLLREFGGNVPVSGKILLGMVDMTDRFGKGGLATLGALVALAWLYFRTARGIRRKDWLLVRVPVVGKIVRLAGMSRFSGSLFTMLVAGLPLAEGLNLTARVVGNTQLTEAVLRAREGLLEGQSLSRVLSQEPIFPPLVAQMVSVGEQSGTLVKNMETLFRFFDQEMDRAISALTALIEPAMVLLVGGAVAFVATAVVSSLYGVLGQIR